MLYQTLHAQQLAGAGLDVFEGEPLRAASPLPTLKNVYLIPYCAGAIADARKGSGTMAAEDLVRALRGERPPARWPRSGPGWTACVPAHGAIQQCH